MKTKLYILALLALLTCGLCLVPAVRHAAAQLFNAAVAQGTRFAGANSVSPRAKDRTGLSSITITPISTGADGERCEVLTTPGLQLTLPTNDYTCKVRVSWNLVEADRKGKDTRFL